MRLLVLMWSECPERSGGAAAGRRMPSSPRFGRVAY